MLVSKKIPSGFSFLISLQFLPSILSLSHPLPHSLPTFPSLTLSLTGYIKNNGYYLIDVTNQSTRWGVWAPEQLNLNRSWSDERGLNSLQILSFLLSAYRITKKTDYLSAWEVGSRRLHHTSLLGMYTDADHTSSRSCSPPTHTQLCRSCLMDLMKDSPHTMDAT